MHREDRLEPYARRHQRRHWSGALDGTDQRAIVEADVTEYKWHWSPDGQKIAYQRPPDSDPTASPSLWLANANGTDAHQITLGNDAEPRWSPDGRRIVFQRHHLRPGPGANVSSGR
jgi:Tol biopolymer transport system component